MKFDIRLSVLFAAAMGLMPSALAIPQLDGPVTDFAVLQRGSEIPLAGTATAGSPVSVMFGDTEISATADASGAWQAELAPLPAGGPYDLTISDADGGLLLHDILVGDVILCSGQSNMEFPVYRALNPDRIISESINPALRLLTIPHVSSISEQRQLPTGTVWTKAEADPIRDFSAVCLATGLAVQEASGVPVGLIDSSWGGSQIEAWLSAADLEDLGTFTDQLSQLALYASDPKAAMRAYGAQWQTWWRGAYDGDETWAGPATGPGWKTAPDIMTDWKAYGDPATADHLGRVWFGKTFTLSRKQAQDGASLSLGLFDDTDATWINGHFLGSTSSWTDPRTYAVPAGFLKRGENTIIVNVRNTYGMGGMLGPNDAVALHLGSTETIPLGSGWTYRVVSEDKAGGPQPPWETVGGYTTIHNAMISPLAGYPLHAALWYQGESNADRGTQYKPLLEQLIASWRKDFGADLPVVVVQLPGYGAMPDKPGPSGWSDVREAQRRVAADDPRTGLAVTMDAGERTDIHPANKAVVAERVTKVLAILTGRDTGFPDGIAPVRAQRNGDAILLEMPNDQLKVIGAARPIAFQVCSESGDCAWADASLDGALITVTVPAGAPAADVRYCWGDAPICNLFSYDDVPVSPFRMALD